MKEIEPMGFIKDCRDLIMDHIPCPKGWAELVSIAAMSVPCENVIFMTGLSITQKSPLRLNIFGQTCAWSGGSYKSLPLNLLNELLDELYNRTTKRFDLPCQGSTEALLGRIAGDEKTESQRSGIIVADEITTLLKEGSKQYNNDYSEILSKFYDGSPIRRQTYKHGEQYVPSCYVSLIGATTPYWYKILPREFFYQGLGNRFLYELYPKNFKEKKWTDDEFLPPKESTLGNNEQSESLIVFLEGIFKLGGIILHPNKDTASVLTDFKNETVELATSIREEFGDLDLRPSYIHRMAANALKLAGLHAMSRLTITEDLLTKPSDAEAHNGIFQIGKSIAIDEYDAEWSVSKSRHFIDNFYTVLEEWKKYNVSERPVETDESEQDFVLSMLKELGGVANKSALMNKTKLNKASLMKSVSYLIDTGRISVETGASTGGRRPEIYKINTSSGE